jgi:hypothetical protein
MMEDAKIYNKDISIMSTDIIGAFNGADHGIMLFKQIRELDMPSSFVTTCEQLYGISINNYVMPHGNTLHIHNNRGTLQIDTLSPCLFTLFLKTFLGWLTVGCRG